MSDIRKFPDSVEATIRLRQREAYREEQRETSSAEDGQQAWDAISEWRLESQQKLDHNDRVSIAQNLWVELEHYKGHYQGKLTDVYDAAGLLHNIKDKVTLQPGKASHAKSLKAEVRPYLDMISALAKKTAEKEGKNEESEKHLLADRVLLGTQFHPVSRVRLQEAQLILDALQVAVDRVDREFGLWEQCMAIAEIRRPREAAYVDAIRKGDMESAMREIEPYIDSVEAGGREAGVRTEKWWPLEPIQLTWDGHLHTLIEPVNATLIEPVNAFWCRRYRHHAAWEAGLWTGESIFFFPHIYLGPAVEWGGHKPEKHTEDHRWVDVSTDPEPHVRFDAASGEYLVYLRDPKTGEEHHANNGDDWGMSLGMCFSARWLIIYPDPDAKRLIPAIFSRDELFYDTNLLPLSARLIAEFGDSKHWEYLGRDGAPTLLQRIKDLTGFVTGDFKVADAWRETAARFHLNPIFRSTNPSESENIIYRRHLEKWIAENRRPADNHEDE